MSKDTDPRGKRKRARVTKKAGAKVPAWDESNRPEWGKLPKKARVFIDEFCIDLSIPRAAEASGYTYGSARVLYCTRWRAAIDETLALRSKEAGLSAQEVLRDLAIIRDKCMGRIPVSRTRLSKDGKTASHVEEFIFDQAGANTATQSIGRHLKLFTDVIESGSHEQALEELLKTSNKLGYKVKIIGGMPVMIEPKGKAA